MTCRRAHRAPLAGRDPHHVRRGDGGHQLRQQVQARSSDFTGREPDENRYSFDKPRFDSYSGRLSFNPDADNAFQVSYGFIKNAEGDGANQHRITASWLYNKPLGEDANFTTALVWGQNNLTTEGKTNSYLAEADYQRGRDTVFTRVENIQKSGHELVLPEETCTDRKFNLGAYTAGYVRDLTHGTGIDTGLGFAVTADTHPSALNADYGGGHAGLVPGLPALPPVAHEGHDKDNGHGRQPLVRAEFDGRDGDAEPGSRARPPGLTDARRDTA